MLTVFSLAMVVVLLGVTILVHEFGHFVVARRLGLVARVFSIGFGPALWKARRNGVLYRIGCIPVGGYVALPQLDPTGMSRIQTGQEGEGGSHEVLPAVAPWKKILVSLAGGAGNMALAYLLAWVVYWVGMPAGPAERSTVVGYVDPASASHAQGLRIGDEILSVNGKAVKNWSEFRMEAACRKDVSFTARGPDGAVKTVRVRTEKGALGEQTVPGVAECDLCVAWKVEPGSSAEAAGIRGGDTIVKFAGTNVCSKAHLVAMVQANRDRPVPVEVKRESGGRAERIALRVTPRADAAHKMVRIGIQFSLTAVEHDTIVHPKPMAQIRSHATVILRLLRALTTPKEAKAASGAVGGPVAVMVSIWVVVKASLMLALWFTGLLNVNLAIINLLPIPVLDGGHIMFSLWEAVTRRPPSARVVNALVNAFGMLLIALFVLLSVRDVRRFTPVESAVKRVFKGRAQTNAVPRAAATNTAPWSTPAPYQPQK